MADWLTDLYKNAYGTAPDQPGYNYWQGIANQYGQDVATKSFQDAVAKNKASGGGGGGGGIDLSFLEDMGSGSESWSGLPDWGQSWAKDWLSTMEPIKNQIADSAVWLSRAPAWIEQTRQNMNKQYEAEMNQNLQDNLRPAIANLSNRGVLSSSTSEGVLGKVLKDLQNKFSDQVANSNVWAGNSIIDNIYKNVAAYQGYGNLINALLGTTRESKGTSQDQTGIYSTLIPILLQGLG